MTLPCVPRSDRLFHTLRVTIGFKAVIPHQILALRLSWFAGGTFISTHKNNAREAVRRGHWDGLILDLLSSGFIEQPWMRTRVRIAASLAVTGAREPTSYVLYRSSVDNSRINRAGLPAQIVHGGTSAVTSEQAPITAPVPIVTPLRIDAPNPIHAFD